MANLEHVKVVRKGAKAIEEWRRSNVGVHMDLKMADLQGVDLAESQLGCADLRNANLSGANLWGIDLSLGDLKWATLIKANLTMANLHEADLKHAILNEANLRNANLRKAKLVGSSLRAANLAEAGLREADLREADLVDANMSAAELSGADLTGADLTRTSLREARIMNVRFHESSLCGADLSECVCGATTFTNVNLSLTRGLDHVDHRGESTIGIDTIFKSGGKIPEAFLRGCGVPDVLIVHIPSLLGAMEPIQYYSCFISYSGRDEEFANRLHGRLEQEKLRVWFAPEEMKAGLYIRHQVEQAIRLHDKLLLTLSEASMASSWVAQEIKQARKRELAEGCQVLFPVRLVSYETLDLWELPPSDSEDLAAEVRKYFIPDFSEWKDHDKFEAAFAKLLRDLKAAGTN